MTNKNQVQLNVLGEKIEVCSCSPMTGWFRDGFCNYDKNDVGNHSKKNNKFLITFYQIDILSIFLELLILRLQYLLILI